MTGKSLPTSKGTSSRKLAKELVKLVFGSALIEVCEVPKWYRPRGFTVCVCSSSSRTRRISPPHLVVWFPMVLLHVLVYVILVWALIHGRLAEKRMNGSPTL